MKNVLCHVSPVEITDYLKPGPDGRIYFSKGEFMRRYGEFLYIFEEDLLNQKYGGHPITLNEYADRDGSRHMLSYWENGRSVLLREIHGFAEYVCTRSIDIRDVITVLKHRDLSINSFEKRHAR